MPHLYKSAKVYDRTAYTLSYIQRVLFQTRGVHLSKVQALDIAVTQLGMMVEKMNDKKNGGC